CFDGSDDAANAIGSAGRLLGGKPAVVLTVCEPIRLWSPSDPATILDVPIGRLLAKRMDLDEIADTVSQDEVTRGVQLARDAGFEARGRVEHGKPWRVICDVGDEVEAAIIVLGARGLSRMQSALLGSVSQAVSTHAGRPVLIVHPARVQSDRTASSASRSRAGQ
ncbi:MAG TPA: universal stress protein, partial [Solirubrobacteraceae bacterium]|nr:universal stress protein [Solirubrobacteraceae bacterium]